MRITPVVILPDEMSEVTLGYPVRKVSSHFVTVEGVASTRLQNEPIRRILIRVPPECTSAARFIEWILASHCDFIVPRRDGQRGGLISEWHWSAIPHALH